MVGRSRSASLLVTFVMSAKMAEPIEMPFGERGADSRRPKKACIRWGQGRTNPFAAARGDKTAMRLFVKILRLVVIFVVEYSLCTVEFIDE